MAQLPVNRNTTEYNCCETKRTTPLLKALMRKNTTATFACEPHQTKRVDLCQSLQLLWENLEHVSR